MAWPVRAGSRHPQPPALTGPEIGGGATSGRPAPEAPDADTATTTTVSETVLMTSPGDVGHEDDHAQGQESNPEPEPQETSTAAAQVPLLRQQTTTYYPPSRPSKLRYCLGASSILVAVGPVPLI